MRCFIALSLPAGAKIELEGIAASYRRRLGALSPRDRPTLSWIASESYHLTLVFLGEIGGTALETAAASLDVLAGAGPIEFSFAGPGFFPPRGRSWHVLYEALAEGARSQDAHRLLNEELVRRAREVGLPLLNPEWPEGRPFSPHITLARAKSEGAAVRLSRGSPTRRGEPERAEAWTISRCSLFKSELRSSGAVYTELKGVDL